MANTTEQEGPRCRAVEDAAGMSDVSCAAGPSLAPEGCLPGKQQNLNYEPRRVP